MKGLPRSAARGLLIGAIIGAIGGALVLAPLELEKNFGLSWLFTVRGAVEPPPDVAIVAIDGRTGPGIDLPELPRDWPRSVHAKVIERIAEAGATAIVLDLDLSRAKSAYEDMVLANAIAAADRVVLYELLIGRRQQLRRPDGSSAGWTWVEERRAPTAIVASAGKALGTFPLPKLGEAVSQFWAFKESGIGAPTTSAIALQLHARPVFERWRALLSEAGAPDLADLPDPALVQGDPERAIEIMRTWRTAFRTRPELAPRVEELVAERQQGSIEEHRLLTSLVEMYAGPDSYFLNFYGPPGSIRTLPYLAFADDDRANPPVYDLEGKVVFLGYSDLHDPEQPDSFYTVFRDEHGIDLSGVEIMATGFGNLLNRTAIRPLSSWLQAGTVIGFGFLVGLLGAVLPAVSGIAFILGVGALYSGAALGAFIGTNLWLPLAVPVLVQVPSALILGSFMKYAEERRGRQAARQQLMLVQQEMEAARRVQQAILPTVFPNTEAVQLFAGTWPAREVGGDFYDVFNLSDGRIGFVVADVSGKGLDAALFMAIARTLLKAYAHTTSDPASCLKLLNDELSEDNDACMFVTVFYGVLDPATGRIDFANAGHNPPYFKRRDGTVEQVPTVEGFAVGVVPGASFGQRTVQVEPGDALVLYTDGVTEAFSPAGEEFAEHRLEDLLNRAETEGAEPLVEQIVTVVRRFMGSGNQSDDITCMVVHYREGVTASRAGEQRSALGAGAAAADELAPAGPVCSRTQCTGADRRWTWLSCPGRGGLDPDVHRWLASGIAARLSWIVRSSPGVSG